MPDGQVLEFSGVTKRFGPVTAVSDFAARVEPGVVTGFLGPNGAGKTTSLRILLGLVRATEGTATIGGLPYAKLAHPLRSVGAALEASSFHPGRTAANHLKVYAQAAGLPASRVDEAIGIVGLSDVAGSQGRRLLARHAAAPRPRVHAARRSRRPRARRARERARPRGHQVDARTAAPARPRGTHRARLVAPALRGVADGRFAADHRPGKARVPGPPRRALGSDRAGRRGRRARPCGSGRCPSPCRSVVRGAAVGIHGARCRNGRDRRDRRGRRRRLSSLQKRGPALEEVFLDLVNGVRVHASAAAGSRSPPFRRSRRAPNRLPRPRKPPSSRSTTGRPRRARSWKRRISPRSKATTSLGRRGRGRSEPAPTPPDPTSSSATRPRNRRGGAEDEPTTAHRRAADGGRVIRRLRRREHRHHRCDPGRPRQPRRTVPPRSADGADGEGVPGGARARRGGRRRSCPPPRDDLDRGAHAPDVADEPAAGAERAPVTTEADRRRARRGCRARTQYSSRTGPIASSPPRRRRIAAGATDGGRCQRHRRECGPGHEAMPRAGEQARAPRGDQEPSEHTDPDSERGDER